MVEVNRIGNYGYYPQATAFTAQRREYRGPEDFKPGLIDPQAEEKAAKRKRNILKAIGVAVVATGAFLFLKKTNMGKNLVQKLKDLFKGTKPQGTKTAETVGNKAAAAADDVAATVKTKKVKVKPQTKVITEQVELAPKEKVKMKNNKGKDAIHKIRRNKKQIIEQTRLREEAEAFTLKDLEAYQKSLGTPATAEELAFIKNNNKAATTSLADVMKEQGIAKGKNSSGRVVLEQAPKAPKAPAAPVKPAPVVDNAAKIADLQAQIAKQDEVIAKYSKPGMERWAKPAQAQKAKLTAELEVLQGKAPAAAPKTVTPAPAISPKEKAAQIEQAWAQYTGKPAPAAPVTTPKAKAPTLAEKFAIADAEAAKMAKEEAEVLEKINTAA